MCAGLLSLGRAAPTIVFKLDDLLDAPYSRDGFARAARVLELNDAKGSFGIILNSCEDDGRKAEYYALLKKWSASGRFELWHHGWDHKRGEFHAPLAAQLDHLRRGLDVMTATCGITLRTFGSPFGEVDASTVEALNAMPEINVWFANSKHPPGAKATVLEEWAGMEIKTGVLSYELFVSNFRKKPNARYLVVLGHPPYWDEASHATFVRIVEFCRAEGCTFATPSEMAARLGGQVTADALTYNDLVRRITDLERLAHPPTPGERVALASSYDRASRYDAGTNRYVKWKANDDGTGVVRMEGESAVLAEINGPGCIWRTWAATIGDGHVKIFLDGAEVPAVDLPFTGYFDGKHEPFTRPQLVYTTTANGFNNLTPIPFQRSCRIVAEKGWGKYYQFTYSQFAPGTRVPTFSRKLSAAALAALDSADRALAASGRETAVVREGTTAVRRDIVAAAGKSTVVADLNGPAAVVALRVKVTLPNDPVQQRRALAELALRITWDDAASPAVWSPLADFFGSAAGPIPFRTLPAGCRDDGTWYCTWYMPFARHAVIAVDNDGVEGRSLSWEVVTAPLLPKGGELLHFHAKWHGDLPALSADRAPDWRLLETKGRGWFVGTQLHVWNPRGGWWGEGDEKFFVDGEKFPSTFGTGSEDYFGYAWSSGKTFVQALHSQPVNEDNRGHVSVNRWHVADAIPFQRSFDGVLEKYFSNENPTLFRAVAYWYLSADGADTYGAVPTVERQISEIRPTIRREQGALEAEQLKVVKVEPLGYSAPQDAVSRQVSVEACSDDRFLIWWPQVVGQVLELAVPVETAGRYRLVLRPLRDRSFGQFSVRLDGQQMGALVDGFAPLPPTRSEIASPVDLGAVDLTAGTHLLQLQATGKNEKATGLNVALDYVQLVRVP